MKKSKDLDEFKNYSETLRTILHYLQNVKAYLLITKDVNSTRDKLKIVIMAIDNINDRLKKLDREKGDELNSLNNELRTASEGQSSYNLLLNTLNQVTDKLLKISDDLLYNYISGEN